MTYDCVILGAGAAGLAAERSLRAAGRSVLLIEAKNRIGGRAYTTEIAPGVTWDHGAQWLHQATTNPMREHADRLGFDYLKGATPRFVFWDRDHWAEPPEEQAIRDYYDACFDAIERIGRDKGDVAAGDALDPDHQWRPLLDYWYHAVVGAPPDKASAADMLRYAPGEGDWPVVQGYGRLLAAVFQDHQARLNCAAEQIDWSGKGVRITTSLGEIGAKTAIVTFSAGVLRARPSLFAPILTDEKLEAAEGLFMARVNKVAILLREDPFGLEAPALNHFHIEEGRSFGMQLRPFGKPMALAYLAGDVTAELEAEGPGALTQFVLDEAGKAWGGAFAKAVEKVEETAWCHDPCFLGGYSMARPGKTLCRDRLADPLDDKLFFAGEGTIPTHSGTVHGAYLSGRRAAEEVKAALLGR